MRIFLCKENWDWRCSVEENLNIGLVANCESLKLLVKFWVMKVF